MTSKYWAFTLERQGVLESACLDTTKEDLTPEALVVKLTRWFPKTPTKLVDKRPISEVEYLAWQREMDRFAEEEANYIDGLRNDPPEW